jgi:mitogen-activated protein kinase kinase kinase 7
LLVFSEFKAQNIQREIEMLNNLKSIYIVEIFKYWHENYNDKIIHCILMEYCDLNLNQLIESMNNLEDDRFKIARWFIASELFKEIIECVNHLHTFKSLVIHRDINTNNILVTRGHNGRFVKLCDFGIAKYLEQNNTKNQGTANYMAPEVKKYSNYNNKVDIYSMAMVAKKLYFFTESWNDL